MTEQTSATVYRLKDYRQRKKPTCFSRQELYLLLSVYSRRVISGEWKAYALDLAPAKAQFSIFANAHAQPLFQVVKLASPSKRNRKYAVLKGATKVAQADTLAQALAYFGRPLKVVSS
jgi:hypothetical protein